ncbi:MAG: hypothetical protein WC908_01415 [Candidatus Paceibacterota bacterium]
MRKNIKYSVSSIIIILSLMLGYVVYAEENEGVNNEIRNKIREVKGELKTPKIEVEEEQNELKDDDEIKDDEEEIKDESENKREEVKNQIEKIKTELELKREEYKNQMEAVLESVKTKREEFKNGIELNKEEAKIKIEAMKASFKESLNKIKDENKKISAEKIVETIQALNTKFTDQFSSKIDQIENVLVSIESRITKAESMGLDLSTVKTEVEKAKLAITDARSAVSAQSKKVYSVNVTSDSALKAEMKTLRDTFSKDIKALREVVKLAHIAVKTTATTLAQIPRIDESGVVSTKVEDNNTND